LYLDILNIFVNILQLFSESEEWWDILKRV
jgi:FtsH-binding integral membrane protein